MTERIQEAIGAYLDAERTRPLGDVTLRSNHVMRGFSDGLLQGAENLLLKAADAIERGDAERAAHLVQRAIRLPFDPHEGRVPALWAAHMILFDNVVDAVEDGAPGWLDIAFAILENCGPDAAAHLRYVLVVVRRDWILDPAEERLIDAKLGTTVPEFDELAEDIEERPSDLARVVLEMLALVVIFRVGVGSR